MKINDKYLVKNVKEELSVIAEALEEAQLSGTGETIRRYEEALAHFFGSKKALAQSSGSAALHTALYCLGVRPGDEVLIPAIAPIPTILPLLTVGARPVVVDIEKDGLGFDPIDLKKKISFKTKAAIVVPLWGYPIDYTETQTILDEQNIPLIEDAAQAHGSKIGEKFVGTFGRVGCFSTHDRKILPTGEGGYILTDDENLYEKMKQFSQLGYMDGKTYGVNHKLSALQAALGTARLKQILPQIAKRVSCVQTLEKSLQETGIRSLLVAKDGSPNYYSLVVRLPWSEEKNLAFIRHLDEKGIPSDIVKYGFCPIYKRPMFTDLREESPNAERFIGSMTTIPVHPGLTEEEVSYISKTMVEAYKEHANHS